jgi:hypothetical protein
VKSQLVKENFNMYELQVNGMSCGDWRRAHNSLHRCKCLYGEADLIYGPPLIPCQF